MERVSSPMRSLKTSSDETRRSCCGMEKTRAGKHAAIRSAIHRFKEQSEAVETQTLYRAATRFRAQFHLHVGVR